MEPQTASMMPQLPPYEYILPAQEEKPQQEWMPTPTALPGCPPGLEYLALLDKILIHQQIDLVNLDPGNRHTKVKYVIKNSVGQQCYFAYEESDNCNQWWYQNDRAFVIKIVDNANMEVIRVIRPTACAGAGCCGGCWCAGCWPDGVTIESPPGTHVATIEQCATFCATNYIVKDPNGKTIFKLNGPSCMFWQYICCQEDTKIKICTTNDEEIGMLKKPFRDIALFRQTNFEASFPQDLDVKMKAAIMGTVFLLRCHFCFDGKSVRSAGESLHRSDSFMDGTFPKTDLKCFENDSFYVESFHNGQQFSALSNLTAPTSKRYCTQLGGSTVTI